MRSILIPQNMSKMDKLWKISKPSIEGSEVEGATHHGLGNVKNSVAHRLGLGRGKHFAFTTEQETFWVCPETPSCL